MILIQRPECQIPGHNQLPICGVCLDIQCKGQRYLCSICQMQDHRNHKSFIIDEIMNRLNFENDIRVQIQSDIMDRFNHTKTVILLKLQELENLILQSFKLEQQSVFKIQNRENLEKNDLIQLNDLVDGNFSEFKQDKLITIIEEIKETTVERLKQAIIYLTGAQLIPKEINFIFQKEFAYQDIKILDQKTISDKLVLSVSNKLGQALIQPSIYESDYDQVEIGFHIHKLGMALNFGVSCDMDHQMYCCVNQSGETYSKFNNNENKKSSQLQMKNGDQIQLIFQKKQGQLTIINCRTTQSVQFTQIITQNKLYFYIQMLFCKIQITN